MKLKKLVMSTLFMALCASSAAHAMDEYGTSGIIPGVSFSGADGSFDRAVKDGLTIGISPDYPWTYQNKGESPAGIDVEIIKDAARRVGIANLKFEIMPIDSVVPSLVSKRIDVVAINLHVNPERLKVVAFTGPAYFYGGAIAVQKGNPKNIKAWEDLSGKTVASYRGSFFASVIEKRRDLGGVQLYSTSAVEFADLAAGRVDAVIDDDTKILKFIEENKNLGIELTNVTIPPSDQLGYARYAVRKEDFALNAAISRALAEMRADGSIKKLLPLAGLPAANMFSYSLEN